MTSDIERAKTSLLAIRDTRRLLIERLPVAWDLLRDETIVFPTRQQFLLDWLLDAAFRLLKGATSTDRLRQLMGDDSFWRLFLTLMEGEGPLRLSKPVLPLFATFIRTFQLTAPPVPDTTIPNASLALVKACMMRLVQKYADTVIARVPLRQVQELFALPAQDVLLEERLYLLLSWQRQQSQQQQQQEQQQLLRLFHELGKSLLIPHILLLRDPDGELGAQVIREFLINGKVIKELHYQLAKPREPSQGSEILLALLPLGAERLLKAMVANAIDALGVSDYRQLILRLIRLLGEAEQKEGRDLPPLTIAKQLVAANMASIQTDDSWAQTCALVQEIVQKFPADAVLLREIIDLDVALLLPHLPQILQLITSSRLELDQITFLKHLVRRQSETRQLDQLIMVMLSNIQLPLPVLLLTDWFCAPLTRLHAQVLRRIAANLLGILAEDASEERQVNPLNVTRFLLVITKANVNAIIGDDLQQAIFRLISEPRLQSAERHGLCSVLEEAEGQWPGSVPEFHRVIVPLAEQLRHAGCSLLSLARGGLSEVSPWILSDQNACIRYLPTLLSRDIIPRIDNLPMAMLGSSLLFWERLKDIDAFIEVYWDQPHAIEALIKSLPPGTLLNGHTVSRCLERFGVEHAEKILMAAPIDVHLEASQIKTLLQNAQSDSLGLIMFQRGWATTDDLLRWDISNRTLTAILSNLTDAQVGAILGRTLAQFPTDNRDIHMTLALLSRRVPNLYDCLCKDHPLLTDSQKWQLAACFHRHGQQSQVGLRLEDALNAYLSGDERGRALLTLKDVMQFTPMTTVGEGCGEREQVTFSLSSEAQSLIREAATSHAHWARLVPLLDAFLTHSLVVQDALCPLVDTFLLAVDGETSEFVQLLPEFGRLLHHRLLCGGTNIGRLQQIPRLLDHVLLLVSHLHCIGDIISILGVLLKFHWSALTSRRPLMVAWLCHLIGRAGEAPRRVARLLADFAVIRQADQHFYVGPLLLAACHKPLSAPVRATLTPALCLLIRHLDQQVSALKAEGLDQEKYFDADPLHRLMAQAETDDARVILKRLISTYMEEYKFTGKA